MPDFFNKISNPRERAAFIAALLITIAIGGVWFSFRFSSSPDLAVKPEVEQMSAVSTPGPLSNIGEKAADMVVFTASRVKGFVELWKKWKDSGSIEYTQEDM